MVATSFLNRDSGSTLFDGIDPTTGVAGTGQSLLSAVFSSSPRWDWYSATFPGDVSGEHLARELAIALDARLESRGPRHGYAKARSIKSGARLVATCMWGNGVRPWVESSGIDAVRVAEFLRRLPEEHRVTRVDSAIDSCAEGMWEQLYSVARHIAQKYGIRTSVSGDWVSVDASRGRTFYIGAPSSVAHVRIYEKGKQLDADPDWVRAELVVRPRRALREVGSHWSPTQVWGVSPWAKDLFYEITSVVVDRVVIPPPPKPDFQRAWETLLYQYRNVLISQGESVGWENFGLFLHDELHIWDGSDENCRSDT